MKRLTRAKLEALPTLAQDQTNDLKVETARTRVWLSRCSIKDGEPYNHKVTVEVFRKGKWSILEEYQAQ